MFKDEERLSFRHPQHRRSIILVSLLVFLGSSTILSLRHRGSISHLIIGSGKPGIKAATNATLGFEKIFALSTGAQWRVDGLHAAAALTGLEIDIPTQPYTPPDVIHAFEELGPPDIRHPTYGSSRAWIAHLDLLKHVVQGGWASALIVEDDVDWDIALLDKIMLPLAQGVRTYTNATTEDSPYGEKWDVLWMGHCGEYSRNDIPYYSWPDETAVSHDQYVGWAKDFWREDLPDGVRTVQPTMNSVCTFAYGTTAAGAQKILHHLGGGKGEAFDVRLSEACRNKVLSCVTIHPEVFHQYVPPNDEYGETSEIAAEDHDKSIFTGAAPHMGTTANIRNSTRCEALYQTTCQRLP